MHDQHRLDLRSVGDECSGAGDGDQSPALEEVGPGAHEVKKPGRPERHCLANERPMAALTLDVLGLNISVAIQRGTYPEASFWIGGGC